MVPEALQNKFALVNRMASHKTQKLLLTGPQGSGKTQAARQFAAVYERRLCVAPCTSMQEPQEWWGARHFDTGRGDYYTPSLFVEAVETPGCVVLLDDMNRVENPKVLNPLLGILSDAGREFVPDIDRFVTVAEDVVFFATINEGWQFVGTDPVCIALRDRFAQVAMQYPTEPVQIDIVRRKTGLSPVQAGKLVRFVMSLREDQSNPVTVSMRQVLLAAEDMAAGVSISHAVRFTFLAGVDEGKRDFCKQKLQDVLEGAELDAWERTERGSESWSKWP